MQNPPSSDNQIRSNLYGSTIVISKLFYKGIDYLASVFFLSQ